MLKKLKSLKSLFVIEDTAPVAQEDASPKEEPRVVTENTRPSQTFKVEKTESSGEGKVQEKFLDVLFSALASSNEEGFDYMEFKDFLKSLANVPMDDSTRYKSAFATAQTMGATKEKIITSAKNYLVILGKEEVKFQDALQSQKQRNLTGKQDEIRQLEQTIKAKEAEIEKLNKEIVDHRSQIGTLETEINSASEKLGQTANDFEATYRALLSQIDHDIQQIQTHL